MVMVMVVIVVLSCGQHSSGLRLHLCGRARRFLDGVHEWNSTSGAESVLFTIRVSAGDTNSRTCPGFQRVHGFFAIDLERKPLSGLKSSGDRFGARPWMAHVLLQPGEKLIHGWIGHELSLRTNRPQRRILGRPGFFFVVHEGMDTF